MGRLYSVRNGAQFHGLVTPSNSKKQVNCSVSTVGKKLRRGIRLRKSSKGRVPVCSAKQRQTVHKAKKNRCCKPHKVNSCAGFIDWVVQQIREHHWSPDACVGYARLRRLSQENKMVSIKTLYNELWAVRLPLSIFEIPDALKRRHTKENLHSNPYNVMLLSDGFLIFFLAMFAQMLWTTWLVFADVRGLGQVVKPLVALGLSRNRIFSWGGTARLWLLQSDANLHAAGRWD